MVDPDLTHLSAGKAVQAGVSGTALFSWHAQRHINALHAFIHDALHILGLFDQFGNFSNRNGGGDGQAVLQTVTICQFVG